jgi:hypothetical protein
MGRGNLLPLNDVVENVGKKDRRRVERRPVVTNPDVFMMVRVDRTLMVLVAKVLKLWKQNNCRTRERFLSFCVFIGRSADRHTRVRISDWMAHRPARKATYLADRDLDIYSLASFLRKYAKNKVIKPLGII